IVPIVKLDARNVTKLPAVNGRRSEYRDELLPAFFLRVSPSGVRTFGVAYNTPTGQRRRDTIGNAARTSLADARDVARRVLADVIKGQDPQQEKVAERRKRRAGVLTFTDLARRFMRENEARLADTTRYNWTNIIDSEIARGTFGAMRPDEINPPGRARGHPPLGAGPAVLGQPDVRGCPARVHLGGLGGPGHRNSVPR